VLIQEIFGVNAHIRADAALWASRGFRVWAPAYFELVARDASGRGPELDYRDRDFVVGRALAQTLGFDVAAEVTGCVIGELRERLRSAIEPNQVMSLGYCWGGAVAFLSATRGQGHRRPDAFVSYYGRAVHDFRFEVPQVPGQFHYGERDSLIPLSQVEAVREAQGVNAVFVYPAGHGFNRRGHADHEPASAELALQRSLGLWSRIHEASNPRISP
jgi:carboxymethylenebutenolidase